MGGTAIFTFFFKQKGLLLAIKQGKFITAIKILQLLISDFIQSKKRQIKEPQPPKKITF